MVRIELIGKPFNPSLVKEGKGKLEVLLFSKEVAGMRFYYIDVGDGYHGRSNFRLWVHYSLVQKKQHPKFPEDTIYYITFPIVARINDGKSENTKILRPDTENWVIPIFIDCGFRGSSYIKVLEPNEAKSYEFDYYHSPVGSLGMAKGLLVQVPVLYRRFKIEFGSYGRRHKEEGIAYIYRDGKIEILDGIKPYEVDEILSIGEEV